jgi:hypothetical protein
MKNPKQITLILGVVWSITLTGCASIVHGVARSVSVASQPSGAKATISKVGSAASVSVNTTPFTILLDPHAGFFRPQSYRIKFELPGYQPAEVMMHAQMSYWYFGNVICGGLVGMLVVDPATGAMWNLEPEKINQPLTAAQASLITSGKGFVVILVSQATAKEKAAMVRIN